MTTVITVHNCIIHELEKEAKKVETKLNLSEGVLEADEFTEGLVLKMHEAFRENASTKNAKFSETNITVFKQKLTNYIDNFKELDFISFSNKSLYELENEMRKENLSSGGFFVFADYSINAKRFIGVALLRKTEGFDTEIKNGIIRIKGVKNLNIEKLAMGFRINLDIYTKRDTDERQYIALITNRKEVSEYFKKWVAAEGVISNESNTNALVKIIKGIELPDRYSSKQEFWIAVYELITSGSEKLAKLRLIGGYFFEDEFKLIHYADNQGVMIDYEFTYDINKLKSLIEIKVKSEGIVLTISRDKIDKNDVKVEDGFIVIHSADLAEKLFSELS